MMAISARIPAMLGMWPAKEFKLAMFWDAKLTSEPLNTSNVLNRQELERFKIPAFSE